MNSICGADCYSCGYGKNNDCKDCGSPFGKQCFVARYIKLGGEESYNAFKTKLIDEFNNLHIDGMPKIKELCPLNGSFVNLSYPMPNGRIIYRLA